MKGKIVSGLAIATLMGGLANATVYVVPPDIDQYKQKTDQAYIDLYKNPKSPIKRGITEESLKKLDALGTPNAILQNGADIRKSADAVVQGKTVADGTEISINLDGTPITLKADNGEWKVVSCGGWSGGKYGSGGSCTQLGTWIKVQKDLGGWTCEQNSKYGCTKQVKTVRQEFFNSFTGKVKVVDQKMAETRSCSKYGCGAWSSPFVDQTLKYLEGGVNLQKAISDGITQLSVPIATNVSPLKTEMMILGKNGKYDNG